MPDAIEPGSRDSAPIVLSDEEAAELYRYTLNDYISPAKYPALMRLLDRCARLVREQPACR
jgi:hypothetical protein